MGLLQAMHECDADQTSVASSLKPRVLCGGGDPSAALPLLDDPSIAYVAATCIRAAGARKSPMV
jgi:hypothetical protein